MYNLTSLLSCHLQLQVGYETGDGAVAGAVREEQHLHHDMLRDLGLHRALHLHAAALRVSRWQGGVLVIVMCQGGKERIECE